MVSKEDETFDTKMFINIIEIKIKLVITFLWYICFGVFFYWIVECVSTSACFSMKIHQMSLAVKKYY